MKKGQLEDFLSMTMTMALMTTLLKSPTFKDALDQLSPSIAGILTGDYQPEVVRPYKRIVPVVYGCEPPPVKFSVEPSSSSTPFFHTGLLFGSHGKKISRHRGGPDHDPTWGDRND